MNMTHWDVRQSGVWFWTCRTCGSWHNLNHVLPRRRENCSWTSLQTKTRTSNFNLPTHLRTRTEHKCKREKISCWWGLHQGKAPSSFLLTDYCFSTGWTQSCVCRSENPDAPRLKCKVSTWSVSHRQVLTPSLPPDYPPVWVRVRLSG